MEKYIRINPVGTAIGYMVLIFLCGYVASRQLPAFVNALQIYKENKYGEGGVISPDSATDAIRFYYSVATDSTPQPCSFIKANVQGSPQLWNILKGGAKREDWKATGIRVGHKIVTGPNDVAAVNAGDLFLFQLLPNSQVMFAELYRDKTAGNGEPSVRIALEGFSGSIVGSVDGEKALKTFRIRGEKIRIHARKAFFQLTSVRGEPPSLEVSQGKILVRTVLGEIITDVRAGERYVFDGDSENKRVLPASPEAMLDMTRRGQAGLNDFSARRR